MDELESMEGEQIGEVSGGKLESMIEGEQLRLAKVGKRLQAHEELRRRTTVSNAPKSRRPWTTLRLTA